MTRPAPYLCLLLLASTLISSSRLLAESAPPASMTLEQLDARIKEVEDALIKAQADRYRQKHDIAYSDPEVMSVRSESSKAEAKAIELRRALNERVDTLDADLRKQKNQLVTMHKEASETQMLSKALERELASAGYREETNTTALIAQLKDELAAAQAHSARQKEAIKNAETAYQEGYASIVASDRKAGNLKKELDSWVQTHQSAFDQMHSNLNHQATIQQLDENRQVLASELQQLHAQRRKMVETTPEETVLPGAFPK